MDIIDLREGMPKFPERKNEKRIITQIKHVMFHHTASTKLSVGDLVKLHTETLHKWARCGYHMYVTKNGIIYYLSDFTFVTNGCKDFNTKCIHVCYEGNYEVEISPYYVESTFRMIMDFIRSKGIKPTVLVHKDKRETLCPGLHLEKTIKSLVQNEGFDQGSLFT